MTMKDLSLVMIMGNFHANLRELALSLTGRERLLYDTKY